MAVSIVSPCAPLSVAMTSVITVTASSFGRFSSPSAVPVSTVCAAMSSFKAAKAVILPLAVSGKPLSCTVSSANAATGNRVSTMHITSNRLPIFLPEN
ncbi:MAG: hypothetical protein WC147_07580 [Syntrophomonas sp.]